MIPIEAHVFAIGITGLLVFCSYINNRVRMCQQKKN